MAEANAKLRLSGRGYAGLMAVLGGALAASLLAALALGSVRVPPGRVLAAIGAALRGDAEAAGVDGRIVLDLRLPRALLAALIGGALAAAGAALQAVMKSPLADPYILGVSSGAAVGAALAMVFGVFSTSLGGLAVTGLAFGTALISVLVVGAVARTGGRLPAVRLLLAGVAWSAFAQALTGLILYLAPEASQVRGVVFWLLGGLAAADWPSALWSAAFLVPGALLLVLLARWQNLLLLGDESAEGLGLDVGRARTVLVVITALMTAASVAFAGAIGFVGLVVPHAVRPFTGPDHRKLLPAAIAGGALLLVWMDALSRTLLAPEELPVGLLTGLLGAPFFLLLLRRSYGEDDA